ncbi:MAG: SDR family oxidoreductase [Solirubrobacterales bacterium]|nr:SDR family oxidoreductase [Solirubrobacterales bacterium]
MAASAPNRPCPARARVPVRRLGSQEEIAAVIVFLCAEAGSNIAGAAWSVDGGAVPGDHLRPQTAAADGWLLCPR